MKYKVKINQTEITQTPYKSKSKKADKIKQTTKEGKIKSKNPFFFFRELLYCLCSKQVYLFLINR